MQNWEAEWGLIQELAQVSTCKYDFEGNIYLAKGDAIITLTPQEAIAVFESISDVRPVSFDVCAIVEELEAVLGLEPEPAPCTMHPVFFRMIDGSSFSQKGEAI